MDAAILKLKSRHETDISRFAVIVSCFAILISCFATRMVWPSAVFAWVAHRAEAGAGRAEGIATPSTHSRVGTDPIAAPSARRCQVVGTIAVITPYYIYSVALMAQLRTLIAEMLSKNCTKVALCAQFAQDCANFFSLICISCKIFVILRRICIKINIIKYIFYEFEHCCTCKAGTRHKKCGQRRDDRRRHCKPCRVARYLQPRRLERP